MQQDLKVPSNSINFSHTMFSCHKLKDIFSGKMILSVEINFYLNGT